MTNRQSYPAILHQNIPSGIRRILCRYNKAQIARLVMTIVVRTIYVQAKVVFVRKVPNDIGYELIYRLKSVLYSSCSVVFVRHAVWIFAALLYCVVPVRQPLHGRRIVLPRVAPAGKNLSCYKVLRQAILHRLA